MYGGQDALPNRLSVRRHDGQREAFPNGKVNAMKLDAGDAFILDAGGGGGYGSPLERPPERVRADVVEGYVSLQAARDQYGVELDERTLTVDGPATERRRSAARGTLPRHQR